MIVKILKIIIKNLIKLENVLNFFYDLFIGKNSYNFSSIVIYYIIKFGGIRQLFKISNLLDSVDSVELIDTITDEFSFYHKTIVVGNIEQMMIRIGLQM